MTDKELRKLSRKDLLQLLLEQSKRLQALEAQYAEAEAKLQSKSITLENAGSIAEAALQLNGVFESAEAACRQYTENITAFQFDREKAEAESREKAQQIIEDAEKKAAALENETKLKCETMLKNAERDSLAYWNDVDKRLNQFLEEHTDLKERFFISQTEKDGKS